MAIIQKCKRKFNTINIVFTWNKRMMIFTNKMHIFLQTMLLVQNFGCIRMADVGTHSCLMFIYNKLKFLRGIYFLLKAHKNTKALQCDLIPHRYILNGNRVINIGFAIQNSFSHASIVNSIPRKLKVQWGFWDGIRKQ